MRYPLKDGLKAIQPHKAREIIAAFLKNRPKGKANDS